MIEIENNYIYIKNKLECDIEIVLDITFKDNNILFKHNNNVINIPPSYIFDITNELKNHNNTIPYNINAFLNIYYKSIYENDNSNWERPSTFIYHNSYVKKTIWFGDDELDLSYIEYNNLYSNIKQKISKLIKTSSDEEFEDYCKYQDDVQKESKYY